MSINRTAATERPASTRRAAPLLISAGISLTGDGALTIAVPLLAATLTSDPLALSAVSAAGLLPWLLFGLHAGALADRWPRRRTMILADLGRAAVLAILVALLATGTASIAVLAAAVVLIGIGQCFFDTSAQGMIPAIVGRDKGQLAWINGKLGALDTVGRQLAGPTLGSVTFAVNRILPFAADVVSFLASAALVRRLPAMPASPRTARTRVNADVREGLRYVWDQPQLRAFAIAMCINNGAYSIAMATFVLFARQDMGISPAVYGLLFAAAAVGGISAGWFARPLTARLSHNTSLVIAAAAQGTAWAGIAVTGNVWVAGVLLAVSDAAVTIGTVAIVSARQELTPDAMLGRATSVFRLGGVGIATGASLAGGALAATLGLHAPLYVAAVILLALAAVMALHPARTPDKPAA